MKIVLMKTAPLFAAVTFSAKSAGDIAMAFTVGQLTPPSTSKFAEHVNDLYGVLLVVSSIFCFLLVGGLIYFAIKHRHAGEGPDAPSPRRAIMIEFLWSVIPFLIFILAFVLGWII